MNNAKLRISRKDKKLLIYIILIFPFLATFSQEALDKIPMLPVVLTAWKFISFFCLLYCFIKRKKTNAVYLYCFCIFIFCLLFSMIISNQGLMNLFKFIYLYFTIIGFMIATKLMIDEDTAVYIKAVYICIIFLIYLNGVLLLFNRNGVAFIQVKTIGNHIRFERTHLLGVDNKLGSIFIVGILINELYHDLIASKSLRYISNILVIVLQALYLWSAACILSIFVLGALIVFKNSSIFRKIMQYRIVLGIYISLFLGIVVFRLQYIFSFVIQQALKKSVDFSGRTDIWNIAINIIKNHIFFGYGDTINRCGIVFKNEFMYAHNLVLDISYQGGVFALLAFFIFLLSCEKGKRFSGNIIYYLIVSSIFAVLLTNLVESFVNLIYFYIPFILLFYCKDLINIKKRGL